MHYDITVFKCFRQQNIHQARKRKQPLLLVNETVQYRIETSAIQKSHSFKSF